MTGVWLNKATVYFNAFIITKNNAIAG